MNKILEVNLEEGWARVQPGVVQDQLNRHLAPMGWGFGPDTSTSNRATIGGMTGNNSCGSRSIVYGKTIDHIGEPNTSCRTAAPPTSAPVDASGLEAKRAWTPSKATSTGRCSASPTPTSPRSWSASRRSCAACPATTWTRWSRRRRRTWPSSWSVGRHAVGVAGHEGQDRPPAEDEGGAGRPVRGHDQGRRIRRADPVPQALGDGAGGQDHHRPGPQLCRCSRARPWLPASPGAIIVVEFYGDTKEELSDNVDKLEADSEAQQDGLCPREGLEAGQQAEIWNLRKGGLGSMAGTRTRSQAPCPSWRTRPSIPRSCRAT